MTTSFIKTVGQYYLGSGALADLDFLLQPRRKVDSGDVVFFIDHYFENRDLVKALPCRDTDFVIYANTTDEPSTDWVDGHADTVKLKFTKRPSAVVGIGGGATLDLAKAVANLLNNKGKASDYQGWGLVPNPGVYKIGVPTLSGTGAEASRTCVMMNYEKNLKLGMNSDHTVYDALVLDPDLTASVPRDQFFYTGLDTYIHCIESLNGEYRNNIADAHSREALDISREIFLSNDMQSPDNREKLMVASYLGGSAIGNSFVGVVHPLSAGLSVVLGFHHCIANCIVMNVMEDFYPEETAEFHKMLALHDISLPESVCAGLSDEQFERLYESSIIHEKPLINALGDGFRDILTKSRVIELFGRM
jgi:3-deoxy-alpha-D-manno-octulosonate 8-oxidase